MSSDPITAFILAGGKSTRMGTDKAFLELAGRPLISHALELARAVSQEIKIVGDPKTFAPFGTAIPDIYPAREKPIVGVTSDLVATALERAGRKAAWQGPRKELASALCEFLRDGDVVITIGAGDITCSATRSASCSRRVRRSS